MSHSRVCHVTKISQRRTAGNRESFTCCHSHFKGTFSRSCVKLYRSSRPGTESVAEKWMRSSSLPASRFSLDCSRVRVPRSATRMPGSVVGRSRMQLRAFNEVSRLAADPTRCGAAWHGATQRRELAFHLVSESIIPSILPGRRPNPPIYPPRSTAVPTKARASPDFAKGIAASRRRGRPDGGK